MDTKVLGKILKACAAVAPKRSAMATGPMVRLSVEDGMLEASATDLQVGVVVITDTDLPDLDVCVNAEMLHKFVDSIQGEEVSAKITRGKLLVEGGGIRATFPTMDGGDFPRIGGNNDGELLENAPIGLIDALLGCFETTTKSGAQSLMGACIEASPGMIRIMSSESGAINSLASTAYDGEARGEFIVMPTTAIKTALAMVGDEPEERMVLSPTTILLHFTGNGYTAKVYSQTVDARFPCSTFHTFFELPGSWSCTADLGHINHTLKSSKALGAEKVVLSLSKDGGEIESVANNGSPSCKGKFGVSEYLGDDEYMATMSLPYLTKVMMDGDGGDEIDIFVDPRGIIKSVVDDGHVNMRRILMPVTGGA